jgi:dihydrofolate reductase
MVIGRHLFDMTNGWGGSPPAGEHVVVVSHRPKPDQWQPRATTEGPHPGPAATYHFVDDVEQAVVQARQLAGQRAVYLTAGDVGGQALALGLVDEVAIDVAPVVFGAGKRYFGSVDTEHLLEDPHTVVQGDRVLHLRYRVARQSG